MNNPSGPSTNGSTCQVRAAHRGRHRRAAPPQLGLSCPAPSSQQSYARVSGLTEGIRSSITKMRTSIPQDLIDYSNSRKATRGGDHHISSDMQRS